MPYISGWSTLHGVNSNLKNPVNEKDCLIEGGINSLSYIISINHSVANKKHFSNQGKMK